ncbi:hypothetical protein OOK31_38575 [Streptomyces sp. NBC_00249]|uniref:hypothetical protein n=1 Tax=Streptomyces sp. NBC_00249 TaxID=2975690 RepID=UPI0022565935|nr:hypothetical protein [Streptomyces sp. NBC_00249]MCX5199718.1 hypothetical protein [Streptomyces sp. NBC_00249]
MKNVVIVLLVAALVGVVCVVVAYLLGAGPLAALGVGGTAFVAVTTVEMMVLDYLATAPVS